MICSCSLRGSPSLEDSSFARTWVFPSCTFFSPFVGCFVFLMIGMFSSFCNGHSSQKKIHILIKNFQRKNQRFKFIVLYWLASLVSHHLFIMGFTNEDWYLYPFEANKLVTISSCNEFMFSSSIISKCRNLFLFCHYYLGQWWG